MLVVLFVLLVLLVALLVVLLLTVLLAPLLLLLTVVVPARVQTFSVLPAADLEGTAKGELAAAFAALTPPASVVLGGDGGPGIAPQMLLLAPQVLLLAPQMLLLTCSAATAAQARRAAEVRTLARRRTTTSAR